mgnify:CR=1 FL=1
MLSFSLAFFLNIPFVLFPNGPKKRIPPKVSTSTSKWSIYPPAAATPITVKKIKDKYNYPVSKEEIMEAIPSDKLNVK